MPESVAKDGKDGKDGKEEKKAKESPKRRPGNLARIKVELLDGSTMDLEADRKIRGHELLSKVCDSLNLVEKDYFGLLYEDRGDPRVWIDLEKRVSKMLKHNVLRKMDPNELERLKQKEMRKSVSEYMGQSLDEPLFDIRGLYNLALSKFSTNLKTIE